MHPSSMRAPFCASTNVHPALNSGAVSSQTNQAPATAKGLSRQELLRQYCSMPSFLRLTLPAIHRSMPPFRLDIDWRQQAKALIHLISLAKWG